MGSLWLDFVMLSPKNSAKWRLLDFLIIVSVITRPYNAYLFYFELDSRVRIVGDWLILYASWSTDHERSHSKYYTHVTLFRKLVKGGKQSAEEVHELIELIEIMAGTNVTERLEAKMDALNSKYTVIIWMIGFAGLAISLAIIFQG